jgi:MoaA/NifB/PqqE/SkfB family radical SAM enzyme
MTTSAGLPLQRSRYLGSRWEKVQTFGRLALFFSALTLKEHIAPNLHVRPLVAELFLTDNCNLRCVSCACWRSVTRSELATEEWEEVLRQLRELGIIKVNFTGGEPLIRKDAVGLMQYAHALGFPSLHLNTNAILLTPAKQEAVLRAGVRSFNVSVDGLRNVHDQIRGRQGAFDRTIGHLRHLVSHRKRVGLKIRLNFTVMRDNVEYLPEIAALAEKLRVKLYLNLATDKTFLFRDPEVTQQAHVNGVDVRAAVRRLEPLLRRSSKWLPRYSDLQYIAPHFSDVVQRGLPCAESQLKLLIRSRGEIGGCWAHDGHANVRTTTLTSVVESARYREDHRRFFRKECVGCGSNYSLNLRWRPTSYVNDFLWKAGWRTLGD